MAESLGKAVLTLDVNAAAYEGKLRKAETDATGAGSKIQAALAPIGGAIAGLVGVGTLTAFFQQSIQGAVELESITRKLSNTLGNQGAAGALAFTRGLSDELGLSFKALSGSFGSFTAAATSANIPLETQKDLFGAVAKAGQALGLSNDEINGSLLALQQVASKGTVQMEELRGQLGERLPIAFSAAARGLGLTQQELIKLVESGKLTAEQFFPALTKGLNELTGGSGGLKTAAQRFSDLANAWDELQTSFGQNLLPVITPQIENLAKALKGIQVDNTARDLRQSFGLTVGEATQLSGELENIQKQFGLSSQEAKNLLSDAIANTGATRDWFSELNLGAARYSQVQQDLIKLAGEFRKANPDQKALTNADAALSAKLLKESKERTDAEAKTAQAVASRVLLQTQEAIQLEGIRSQIEAAGQLESVYRDSTKTFEQQNAAAARLTAQTQQQATIQAALNAERQISAQIDRELAKPVTGKDARQSAEVDSLLSRLAVAREDTRRVLAEAGAEAARAIAQAADALKNAQSSFQSFQQSNFDFLTDSFQKQLLADARTTVNRGVSGGFLRGETPIGTPDQLFRAADFVKGFESQREAVKLAQDQLVTLQGIRSDFKKGPGVSVTVKPIESLVSLTNLLPE